MNIILREYKEALREYFKDGIIDLIIKGTKRQIKLDVEFGR